MSKERKCCFQKTLLNVNLVWGISFNTITMSLQKEQENSLNENFCLSNATFNLIFDCENPIQQQEKRKNKCIEIEACTKNKIYLFLKVKKSHEKIMCCKIIQIFFYRFPKTFSLWKRKKSNYRTFFWEFTFNL